MLYVCKQDSVYFNITPSLKSVCVSSFTYGVVGTYSIRHLEGFTKQTVCLTMPGFEPKPQAYVFTLRTLKKRMEKILIHTSCFPIIQVFEGLVK